MDKNIKAVFDRIVEDFVVDADLIKRLSYFETEFTHRNPDHVNFFSGNLLGVDKVRFLPSDYARFFDEVVMIDDTELQRALHALPSINTDWVVSSDVFNITSMWLIHAIGKATHLPENLRTQGMLAAALIFNYKVLTSKLAHDFKFPADRETAIAVYAALTKKYSLKRYGSWGALLKARSEDMIRENGLHWKTIQNFNDDKNILYMITDSQGRIRDIVKTLWDVLIAIRESDAKIVSTTSLIAKDGLVEVGDLQRKLVVFKEYIHAVAGIETSFIKPEIFTLVTTAMRTNAYNPDHLLTVLKYFSAQYSDGKDPRFERLLDDTMVHAFDILNREAGERKRQFNYGKVIFKLRGVYMASKGSDPYVLALRELGDDIVSVPLKGKSIAAQIATRTSLLLYIVLRALTRDYYG